MNTCLVCSQRVRFVKFKCIEGYLCKKCYQVASNNYSSTINKKSILELKPKFEKEQKDKNEFEMTKKIQQLVLFDEKNKRLCLPNHYKYAQKKLAPVFFNFDDIINCSLEENISLKKEKKRIIELGTIKVSIREKKGVHFIWLIGNPINTASLTYKSMKTLSKKIEKEVQQCYL